MPSTASQIHASAESAVAPVGAAEGHELLAPKADTAAPAVAGLHLDLGFVDEFHEGRRRKSKGGAGRPGSPFLDDSEHAPAGAYFAMTLTKVR